MANALPFEGYRNRITDRDRSEGVGQGGRRVCGLVVALGVGLGMEVGCCWRWRLEWGLGVGSGAGDAAGGCGENSESDLVGWSWRVK